MPRCLICLALLLGACGPDRTVVRIAAPPIPADLLQPVPSYAGPVPMTEGQLVTAMLVTAQALDQANAQIVAIGQILSELPLASD